MTSSPAAGWRAFLPDAVRPYAEPGPLGALALGMSSGYPIATIAANLSTRLAEEGLSKKTVTAFGLALLMYNLKVLWAPAVDRYRIPLLADAIGQRRAWLLVTAIAVVIAVTWLGFTDPSSNLAMVAAAAVAVGFAGATFDIVIDAYRIENLTTEQLGAGSGMTQYGWRLGNFAAGAVLLTMASRAGWSTAYLTTTIFVLPALLAAWLLGEPERRGALADSTTRGWRAVREAVFAPLADFLKRHGAIITLMFVLFHKIGDTIANLSLRLLFNELGFSKDEVAVFDLGVGLVALLAGIFIGGIMFKALGMKRTVLISLILMAVSNLGFAWLAQVGHSNEAMALTIGFENFSSGIGGVAVGAYFAALCDLRFTATQFALLSAAASIVGRAFSASTAGGLIESLGFVDFYILTTVLALPGILIFVYMLRLGLVDDTIPDRPDEPHEP